MSSIAPDDVLDVLIVGGGPVGAAAAALLSQMTRSERTPMRIALLEPRRVTPLATPAHTMNADSSQSPIDLRVSA